MKRVYEDIGKVVVAIVLFHLITISLKMVDDWAEASGDETLQSIVSTSFGFILIWILANGLIRIFESFGIKFGKRKDGE